MALMTLGGKLILKDGKLAQCEADCCDDDRPCDTQCQTVKRPKSYTVGTVEGLTAEGNFPLATGAPVDRFTCNIPASNFCVQTKYKHLGYSWQRTKWPVVPTPTPNDTTGFTGNICGPVDLEYVQQRFRVQTRSDVFEQKQVTGFISMQSNLVNTNKVRFFVTVTAARRYVQDNMLVEESQRRIITTTRYPNAEDPCIPTGRIFENRITGEWPDCPVPDITSFDPVPPEANEGACIPDLPPKPVCVVERYQPILIGNKGNPAPSGCPHYYYSDPVPTCEQQIYIESLVSLNKCYHAVIKRDLPAPEDVSPVDLPPELRPVRHYCIPLTGGYLPNTSSLYPVGYPLPVPSLAAYTTGAHYISMPISCKDLSSGNFTLYRWEGIGPWPNTPAEALPAIAPITYPCIVQIDPLLAEAGTAFIFDKIKPGMPATLNLSITLWT